MLKKYYLGGFFWAPIPHKRYQNTSGFAVEKVHFKQKRLIQVDTGRCFNVYITFIQRWRRRVSTGILLNFVSF